MTPTSPEQEKPPREVVRLGQKFTLFPHEWTISKPSPLKNEIPMYSSEVILTADEIGLPNIPFTLSAPASNTRKTAAITPFTPEVGYQISQEDLHLSERIQKLQAMDVHASEEAILREAPLWLNARANDEVLEQQGLTVKSADYLSPTPHFTSDASERITKLRLQVTANGLSFESIPDTSGMGIGSLGFYTFYPLDTGPLPTDQFSFMSFGIKEGLSLHIPSDRDIIASIIGKFVIRRER